MLKRILIANRGEIAVRIARAAADLGIATVAVYAEDDRASGHLGAADEAIPLGAVGVRAYLDGDRLVAIAREASCDGVHPGYGFLSESAAFAEACTAEGLTFIGPTPETLRTLGDKARARALAAKHKIPLLAGTNAPTTLAEARKMFAEISGRGRPLMIKALAGGGGRGIRIVERLDALDDAYARAQSEARAAFGNGDVYVEELMPAARHIEVQIVGDGHGGIVALGERECTLQRRHQKLVELAPSPSLHAAVRTRLIEASVTLAKSLAYRGLGTFEFLVDAETSHTAEARWAFMEANPRVQVEHTVTEAAYGVDLVAAQLRIAGGARLGDLGLVQAAERGPGRAAMQLRINAETIGADGVALASAGTVRALALPSGPGVRVDTHLRADMPVSPAYDSLIAKIVVDAPLGNFGRLLDKADRALSETSINGIATGVSFLRALLASPDVRADRITTRTIDQHAAALAPAAAAFVPSVLTATTHDRAPTAWVVTDGTLIAPVPGSVVSVAVAPGAIVTRGQTLAVVSSMKMEHLIEATSAGRVTAVHASVGDVVAQGQPLFDVDADGIANDVATDSPGIDLDRIRPDLADVIAAHRYTHDSNRPDAVAKRHRTGMRTVRENLDDLLDPGSFIEYGALAVAAQRARRSVEDLQKSTPADGLVTGLGTVNAAHTTPDKARVAVMAYDYMVLAGTQGKLNHRKSDRILDVAAQWKLPFVLFAEGGGGRPGDTDHTAVSGLDCTTFHHYAALSGVVPVVGIVAGRCFAGNAALLGCSDVIIATENSSIGMGGPAMIEGGGLGIVAPEEVGPVSVNGPNGVIDVLVKDEKEAVAAAKLYLSYVQGARAPGPAKDQRFLRSCVPENRLRVYDIRTVIETLADEGSVLELRRAFGIGAVTAFIRIDGKPFGLIANNPKHLGGAIDAPACDKLARFLQLCDAYGLPVVSLCDTPGFMVGPDSEKSAMVRKTSRLFVIGAALRVPLFTIVLRKGYGLGAMGMTAGMFHAPLFNVSWPSGEFGPMGLEGAVRLGYKKELEAVAPDQRDALFQEMVAKSYARGKATNMGAFLEIDAVIDPADTRRWILRGLASAPAELKPRRAVVDPW